MAWVEKIEEMKWGAGMTLMKEVAPNWDGEDELFDITAEDAIDLPLLPNLKQVKAGFDAKNAKKVVAAFAAKGVKLLPYFA